MGEGLGTVPDRDDRAHRAEVQQERREQGQRDAATVPWREMGVAVVVITPGGGFRNIRDSPLCRPGCWTSCSGAGPWRARPRRSRRPRCPGRPAASATASTKAAASSASTSSLPGRGVDAFQRLRRHHHRASPSPSLRAPCSGCRARCAAAPRRPRHARGTGRTSGTVPVTTHAAAAGQRLHRRRRARADDVEARVRMRVAQRRQDLAARTTAPRRRWASSPSRR